MQIIFYQNWFQNPKMKSNSSLCEIHWMPCHLLWRAVWPPLTRINMKLKLRRKKLAIFVPDRNLSLRLGRWKWCRKPLSAPADAFKELSLWGEKFSEGYKESKWDPASIQAVDITHRTCCCSFCNSVAEGKLQSPWDRKGSTEISQGNSSISDTGQQGSLQVKWQQQDFALNVSLNVTRERLSQVTIFSKTVF